MVIPYPKRKVLSDDDHKDDKDKVNIDNYYTIMIVCYYI